MQHNYLFNCPGPARSVQAGFRPVVKNKVYKALAKL
jgi:hypothetical protein